MKAEPNDDLTLKTSSVKISGWTSVRVTASIDRCPRDFQINMTERYPGEFAKATVLPGDPCQVYIGSDRIVTGYVDRIQPAIASGQHSVTVVGRGQCADLVDCSADWPGNQISNVTILRLAQKLADKFGIAVEGVGDMGSVLPQFNFNWGETSYAVIERAARSQGLLVYETAGGNLMLSAVGTAVHASGFREGENIERAITNFGVDQRFSNYIVRLLSFSSFGFVASGTDIIETIADTEMAKLKLTNGKPRERLLYIIAEQSPDIVTARRQGLWEAAYRAGRSQNIALTCDSWRDSADTLWTPNQLARIEAPTLKLPDSAWSIAEVTFRRDAQGTHADLLLMPPEALQPEPFLLVPVLRGLVTPNPAPNNPASP